MLHQRIWRGGNRGGDEQERSNRGEPDEEGLAGLLEESGGRRQLTGDSSGEGDETIGRH